MADYLVLNCTRMGDLVQTTPLLSGLKQRQPGSRITMLVADRFAAIAGMMPAVDKVLVWDQAASLRSLFATNGLSEAWRHHQHWLRELRPYSGGTLVNLSHSRDSALLARLLKPHRCVGLQVNRFGDQLVQGDWLRYFYNMTGLRREAAINLTDIYRLALGLGPREGLALELQAPAEAEEWAHREVATRGVSRNSARPLVLLQLGASETDRCWPVSRYAELAMKLTRRWGAVIGLLGSKAEAALAEEFLLTVKGCECINWIGATNFEQLVALCGKGAVLVGNDTGTAHIAASQSTPVVGLYFATAHPAVTAPRQHGDFALQAVIPCGPCSHHVHCPHVMCRDLIDVESVYHAVGLQLARRGYKSAMNLGEWPKNKDLRVHRVIIGDDGCQDLELVSHTGNEADIAVARGYRKLWLESLGRDTKQLPNLARTEPAEPSTQGPLQLALSGLERSAGRAHELLNRAGRLLASPGVSAGSLQSIGAELERIEDELHRLREGVPQIRPLMAQFRLEREAVDDSGSMQSENRQIEMCYTRLAWRAQRLLQELGPAQPPVPPATEELDHVGC